MTENDKQSKERRQTTTKRRNDFPNKQSHVIISSRRSPGPFTTLIRMESLSPQIQPQMILDSLLHPPFSVNPDRRHPRQIQISQNQFRRDLRRRTIEVKARLLYNTKTRPPSTVIDFRDDDLYTFECKLLKIRWDKMGKQSRRTSKSFNRPIPPVSLRRIITTICRQFPKFFEKANSCHRWLEFSRTGILCIRENTF